MKVTRVQPILAGRDVFVRIKTDAGIHVPWRNGRNCLLLLSVRRADLPLRRFAEQQARLRVPDMGCIY